MPKQTKKQKTSLFEINVSLGRVSLTQRALFAKNLSVMLESGLSLDEAISISSDSAEGKLKKVLASILSAVRSGRSLSSAFSDHPKVFSGLMINSVYAGEHSGTLTINLANVAQQLEKEKELASKIKGAMLYPLVVLVAAFILGIVLSFVVLPKIVPLFEGLNVDLPITTRGLIWFSHLVRDWGVYLFFGIFATTGFIVWLLRQKFMRPLTHKFLLTAPIIRDVVRNANLARFCRTLGTSIKSGLTIEEALDVTKKSVGNFYFKNALDKVTRSVSKGTKLSANLERSRSLFPLLATRMIRVGEESGKLDETLFYLADFYEERVDTATKTMSTAIEPILLLAIGVAVGFLALSIITPIYDITGNIKG